MLNYFMRQALSETIDKKPYKVYQAIVWTLVLLIAAAYTLYLDASFGNDPSPVFLNVDQAYFKSIVHGLEKKWQFFPPSMENKSNIAPPYHHLDSQLKWLLTLITSTNNAFFTIDMSIFILLVYAIWQLKIPWKYSILLLLFTVSMLRLPPPGEFEQMVQIPFDFQLKSDVFGNSNTILAYAIIALTWKRTFPIRLMIYFLSFYIKSPAVPALFLMEIYLSFSDHRHMKQGLKKIMMRLLLVVAVFYCSYFLFFNDASKFISDFVSPKGLIEFHINTDINWMGKKGVLCDTILFLLLMRAHAKESIPRGLLYVFYALITLLALYDTIGVVRINMLNFYQIIFFLKYLIFIIVLSMNPLGKVTFFGEKLLSTILVTILVFNCYFFSHFIGALALKNYQRFSEFLDNRPIIEIVAPIANEDEMIAINTVASPIRKNKERRLCGIIKNPLWVTSLSVFPEAKNNVEMDWKLLLLSLKGRHVVPTKILWIIIDKSVKNYNQTVIEQQFSLIKETGSHLLFKRKKLDRNDI